MSWLIVELGDNANITSIVVDCWPIALSFSKATKLSVFQIFTLVLFQVAFLLHLCPQNGRIHVYSRTSMA